MGYRADNAELMAYMQKHDYDEEKKEKTHYSFGRPITEINASLKKLTRQQFAEKEISGVFLEGSPRRQYMQRLLYQKCAERWAKWWELHWRDYTHEKEYSLVKLAPLEPFVDDAKAVGFPQGPQVKIDGRSSGHCIESVRDPNAEYVFLDFDTGRKCGLPKHLKAEAGQPERLDDILAWAAVEGFDLMGTEYKVPGSDKSHYVLRGLGLTTWQIKTERWKTFETEIKAAKPFDMGTRTDGLLASYDKAKGHYLPEETATFLFQTREGGFGAIFVGVEVYNTNVQPGRLPSRDEELNPVAFRKGRRFAYTLVSIP